PFARGTPSACASVRPLNAAQRLSRSARQGSTSDVVVLVEALLGLALTALLVHVLVAPAATVLQLLLALLGTLPGLLLELLGLLLELVLHTPVGSLPLWGGGTCPFIFIRAVTLRMWISHGP